MCRSADDAISCLDRGEYDTLKKALLLIYNTAKLYSELFVRATESSHARNNDTHTHTHRFNGPFSGITQVSLYQKGKTNLDFTEARDSEWQWHQLGCMQVCTSLQTDNHASTPPLSFYRPDALPAANQQRQSTEGKK